jgi:hypothetical protein
MAQPTVAMPPRRAESAHTAPARAAVRSGALRLAVTLATPQTPVKAIVHMADAFEAWLTRPVEAD